MDIELKTFTKINEQIDTSALPDNQLVVLKEAILDGQGTSLLPVKRDAFSDILPDIYKSSNNLGLFFADAFNIKYLILWNLMTLQVFALMKNSLGNFYNHIDGNRQKIYDIIGFANSLIVLTDKTILDWSLDPEDNNNYESLAIPIPDISDVIIITGSSGTVFPSGVYKYALVSLSKDGSKSNSTILSSSNMKITLSADASTINLTLIPIVDDYRINKLLLFRTTKDTSDYGFIIALDNIATEEDGTISYIDITPDNQLQDLYSIDVNNVPISAQYALAHKDRLWLANITRLIEGDPINVRPTEPLKIEIDNIISDNQTLISYPLTTSKTGSGSSDYTINDIILGNDLIDLGNEITYGQTLGTNGSISSPQDNYYIEFSITTKTGKLFTFNRLSMDITTLMAKTEEHPNGLSHRVYFRVNYDVRLNSGGVINYKQLSLSEITVIAGNSRHIYSDAINLVVDNSKTLYFRIYFYGLFGLESQWSIKNLSINGFNASNYKNYIYKYSYGIQNISTGESLLSPSSTVNISNVVKKERIIRNRLYNIILPKNIRDAVGYDGIKITLKSNGIIIPEYDGYQNLWNWNTDTIYSYYFQFSEYYGFPTNTIQVEFLNTRTNVIFYKTDIIPNYIASYEASHLNFNQRIDVYLWNNLEPLLLPSSVYTIKLDYTNVFKIKFTEYITDYVNNGYTQFSFNIYPNILVTSLSTSIFNNISISDIRVYRTLGDGSTDLYLCKPISPIIMPELFPLNDFYDDLTQILNQPFPLDDAILSTDTKQYKNGFVWSQELSKSSILSSSFDFIGNDDGAAIVGMFPVEDGIIFFKENSVYRLYTNGQPEAWTLYRIIQDIGAVQNSIAKHDNTYYYLFGNTAYELTMGSQPKDIGALYQRSLSKILSVKQTIYDTKRQWYILNTISINGNSLFIYDVKIDTWYEFVEPVEVLWIAYSENFEEFIILQGNTIKLYGSKSGRDYINSHLVTKTWQGSPRFRLRKLSIDSEHDNNNLIHTINEEDNSATYTDSSTLRKTRIPTDAFTDSLKVVNSFSYEVEGFDKINSIRIEVYPINRGAL